MTQPYCCFPLMFLLKQPVPLLRAAFQREAWISAMRATVSSSTITVKQDLFIGN